ncbi:ABC transporter ATP-binding protein [Cellulomonas sp. PhB150]|uniref:ABC transporter ATP-binding protein n=1 Tax=Cellulomonas sp. PhB150 TaxID=2485188 RepID=UPI000F469FBE|nr:ATP-binding cassette domain-containing protein [Cellulomonas sp. PhB150]ROS31107.1 putative ABC transport system ATP-binding protein/lipoprotein-releasing system ATP-binding protein [Cellulomonas sp. PhB150]
MSLALTDVSLTYPGTARAVLTNLNLFVPTGTSLALMGPSGTGKSTALAIAGLLLAPTSGEVTIDGQTRTVRDAPTMLRGEIAWVLQSVNLLPRRTALDNVLLPALAAGGSRDDLHDDAVEVLLRVGIESPDQVARTLSGGQAQRVGVARALMSRPAVIIADEPTANLDIATGRGVARALLQAATETTVLLATHDEHVAEMADAILRLEPEVSGDVAPS